MLCEQWCNYAAINRTQAYEYPQVGVGALNHAVAIDNHMHLSAIE